MPPSAGLSGIRFQNNQDGLNDPKGNKVNLHYDDVQPDYNAIHKRYH